VAVATVLPFVVIPSAVGAVVTLALVSVFPARRARDVLMLMGLLFAVAIVVLLRFIRPERLLSVQSLPDITAFFATLQSPITPFLPSFWAGESLFAALRGGVDLVHLGALWTTALAFTVLAGPPTAVTTSPLGSKAQEARKARFTRLTLLDPLVRRLPFAPARRALLVKDLKVFLRDTTQWSQLLLLVALASSTSTTSVSSTSIVWSSWPAFQDPPGLLQPPSGRVRDLGRGRAVRLPRSLFRRPRLLDRPHGASPNGVAAVVEVLDRLRADHRPLEGLTVGTNRLLGVLPFLQILSAVSIAFMTLALVGLAAGMGAQHPRFNAENITQVAGSYGGVAYMVLAVLYVLTTVALVGKAATIYLPHGLYSTGVPMRDSGMDCRPLRHGRGAQRGDVLVPDASRRPGPRGARVAGCYDRRLR